MSQKTTSPTKLDIAFKNRFRGLQTAYTHGKGESSDFRLTDEDPEVATQRISGETMRFKAAGGQVLTATLFNQGQKNLTLIHPGWLGDGEHANTELQVNLLAQYYDPNTTFAYINMPGKRGSEALPDEVMKEMKRTGSFEAYGEEIATAFDVLRKDFETTNGVGWSTGARAMFGVLAARHNESGMDRVVAIDPPGSRKLGLLGIIYAFGLREGMNAGRYVRDQQIIDAMKTGAPKSSADSAATWQAMYGFPLAMSRAGLEGDLLKATAGLDDSHSIAVVSPELSALNMPADVAEIMRLVSLKTDARLIHYIIDQQSHTGIMDQNAPLFIRLVTDLLQDK